MLDLFLQLLERDLAVVDSVEVVECPDIDRQATVPVVRPVLQREVREHLEVCAAGVNLLHALHDIMKLCSIVMARPCRTAYPANESLICGSTRVAASYGIQLAESVRERESCLLVLNSVTSTPQWIHQPKAACGP
jgi:hypothetical protein